MRKERKKLDHKRTDYLIYSSKPQYFMSLLDLSIT